MKTVTANNLIESLDFRTIRPISRADLPRNSRGFSIKSLQVVKDFITTLDTIGKLGITPYEVLGELDMQSKDVVMAKAGRKAFVQSFRSFLKEAVKSRGLAGKLDVMESGHGSRFFLVGREYEMQAGD